MLTQQQLGFVTAYCWRESLRAYAVDGESVLLIDDGNYRVLHRQSRFCITDGAVVATYARRDRGLSEGEFGWLPEKLFIRRGGGGAGNEALLEGIILPAGSKQGRELVLFFSHWSCSTNVTQDRWTVFLLAF